MARSGDDIPAGRPATTASGRVRPSTDRNQGSSLEETQAILQDLRLHQIELEVQNEELVQTQAKLHAAREQYFDLYNLAPVGYCTVNAQGLILQANLTAATLLGVVRSELILQPVSKYISSVDQDVHYLRCRRLMESGEPQSYDIRMAREGASEFWSHIETTAVRDDDSPAAIRLTLIDITEGKRAQADREALEAQLRESQKMEAMGTLAGGIAHEFNNLIATILGNLRLASEDVQSDTKASVSLEEIRKATRRAGTLVQSILAFSRREPDVLLPTALAAVVEEAVGLLRPVVPAGITLAVDCAANLPNVLANPNQLEQVLLNLITNSMQSMRGGPGSIDVRLDTVTLDTKLLDAHVALRALSAEVSGRVVRLTISDDGPGMDSDVLARIFEPFFTTKLVTEGTGLGLSVVHGIVEAHNAVITVTSAPGKGSTFTVYLPPSQTQAEPPRQDRLAAVAIPNSDSDSGGDRHIVYIDDDEPLVSLVVRSLERQGQRITAFTDAREALTAIRADPSSFHLVVSDYNMPGMSGLDVAREVHAIRADLPVAVATGFIDETLRGKALGAGVCEVIFKADRAEELSAALARLAQQLAIDD